jgi:hypothetical protein
MIRRKIDDELLLKMVTEENKSGKECAAFFNCTPAAISKRLRRLTPVPLPASLEALTEQRRKFCVGVASGKSHTAAAFDSFECSSRASAKQIGKKLMKSQQVVKAIEDVKETMPDIMAAEGLTPRYRVRKLKKLVDHKLPDISLRALDQSHKLSGSYQSENRHETTNYIQINLQTGDRMGEERQEDSPDIVLRKGKSYIFTTGGEEHE